MKRILKFFLGAVIASASIAAHAQVIQKETYKAPDASVFALGEVRKVKLVSGRGLVFTYKNGMQSTRFVQDSGQLFNKIRNDHPEFVLNNAQDSLYLARAAYFITCVGSQTVFTWPDNTTETIGDGCQIFNTLSSQ